MKQLLLLLLITQISIAQDFSWIEYPVNCNETDFSVRHITDQGHYVGYLLLTGGYFYTSDEGVTQTDLCTDEFFNFEITQHINPQSDEFIYAGLKSIYNLNTQSGECEILVSDNDLRRIEDAILNDLGEVVLLDNDNIVFYDTDGNKETVISIENISREDLHFQSGFPTYITYNKWMEDENYIREINLTTKELGPELLIASEHGYDFKYQNGTLYSPGSFSEDGGITWTLYQGLPTNELIETFDASGDEILLISRDHSFYSSDKGQSFEVNMHGIPSFNNAILISKIIEDKAFVFDRILSNNIVATSTDNTVTWNTITAKLELPNNRTIVAASEENLFASNNCTFSSYDPTSASWQDFNSNQYNQLKALPNDNLITVDYTGYNLSTNLGVVWNYTPWDFQIIETITEIVCKEGITYLTGFEQTLYSIDNGETFELWEPSFWLYEDNSFDLFSDSKVIIYDEFSDPRNEFFVYDFETQEKTFINKSYDSDIHLDIATAWSGPSVHILEYQDNSQSQLILQSSDNEGQNFIENVLPFSLQGDNIKLITDHNDNLIIYSTRQIFISQDKGNTWKDITPTQTELREITDLTISFDDYLYISTLGTGILRLDCKVNMDITNCTVASIDADNDGYTSDEDCDDGNPNIYPGAPETCNALDDNCDGVVDEGLPQLTLYMDFDGDRYGDPDVSILDCTIREGYVENNTDCNDNDININPGAIDIPGNGIDEDCNGMDAPGLVDNDNDGFMSDVDCNDNDATIYPGAAETCNDTDDNCDGRVDEGLIIARYYYDGDNDGFGDVSNSVLDCKIPDNYVNNFGDCDDSNSNINPDAIDTPANGVDEDCDGMDAPAFVDNDNDGFGAGEDCNDNNANVYPGAIEICNGIDDNCDGIIDEGIALITSYEDGDGDGYGDPNISITDCVIPNGYVENSSDCNDSDPAINPGETEVPYNGIDEDCDQLSLDDDLDQDNFLLADDCNDEDPSINPDAMEIPNNGIDEDCDGMDLVSSTSNPTSSSFNIYPNPSTDFISIIGLENISESYRYEIYSLNGEQFMLGNTKGSIDISSISSGLYFLRIVDSEISYMEMFVKI